MENESGPDATLDTYLDQLESAFGSAPDPAPTVSDAVTSEAEAVAPPPADDTAASSAPSPATEPLVAASDEVATPEPAEPEQDWRAVAEQNRQAAENWQKLQEGLTQIQRQKQFEQANQRFIDGLAERLQRESPVGGDPSEFKAQAQAIAEQIQAHPRFQQLQSQVHDADRGQYEHMTSAASLLLSIDSAKDAGLLTAEQAEALVQNAQQLRLMPTFEAMQAQTQRDAQLRKHFSTQITSLQSELEALRAEKAARERIESNVDLVPTGSGAPAQSDGDPIDAVLDRMFGF